MLPPASGTPQDVRLQTSPSDCFGFAPGEDDSQQKKTPGELWEGGPLAEAIGACSNTAFRLQPPFQNIPGASVLHVRDFAPGANPT